MTIQTADSASARYISVMVSADYLLITPLVGIVTGYHAIPLSATASVPLQAPGPQ